MVGKDGVRVSEDEAYMKHHSKLITCKFILELYSGNNLDLSEIKTANETGPIQSPTKHYEFELQPKSQARRAISFLTTKIKIVGWGKW